MVDLFWPGLLVMVAAGVFVGLTHALDERRWKREAEEDEAAKRPAE